MATDRQTDHATEKCVAMCGIAPAQATPPNNSSGIDGWARFNVPLDTVQVISETFLQVRWPNQQCQSAEGGWL